jgi:argininosuccinate lyase
VTHTHEGSIGNLCLDEIKGKMKHAVSNFDFDKTDKAIEKLLFGVQGNQI